jgi:hypothetical protein
MEGCKFSLSAQNKYEEKAIDKRMIIKMKRIGKN